ncbi:MAG: 4a-hydroxytetrahydrobiopterin dehydratase [Bacteroidota bacterium]|nr:4a-hydroxytetrahydrobiopterin dehydratase [Bacteroidota bacterium]
MSEFSRKPLSDDAIQAGLAELDGWELDDDAIQRLFEFRSFREAMSFMVRIGFEAEDMDHHPELSNVYNRVHVALSTHDAGNKVTELDLELARRINHFSWI